MSDRRWIRTGLGVLLAVASLELAGCGPCEGPGELIIDLDDAVIPATMHLRGIVRIDGGHLAVGTSGVIVRRQSDSDWTPIGSMSIAELLAVDQWGPRIIVVGRDGTVLRSDDDGLTFEALDFGAIEDLHAVLLDGQRGVIVGDQQIAWSSDGGDSWSPASLPAGGAALRGVAADGETLWAVALAGVLLRSDDDGASWSAIASPVSADLWAIGYAGVDLEVGLYAVGDGGTILRLESSGWTVIDHEIDGDFRAVRGNYIVGLGGLVVAVEIDEGSEPQRLLELGRDPARGDLWDVVDELAVGDQSRLTTIGVDWVVASGGAFCRG